MAFISVPRDINERGRDLDAVLTQYMTFVKPAFEEFCSPVSQSHKVMQFTQINENHAIFRRKSLLTLLYREAPTTQVRQQHRDTFLHLCLHSFSAT